MNLIETIFEEMLSDMEDSDKQSEYLIDIYQNSQHQLEIDACFICLCGYSLSSLISM